MLELFYPVSRLFADPRLFYAIANYLEGPDGDTLKDAFYDMMEHGLNDYEDLEDMEFTATEVRFAIESDDKTVTLTFDTGLQSVLKPLGDEMHSEITNDHEMAATSAIYDRIVTAIVDANPDFKNNIALCSPPTPGNSYLRSSDGERFEGSFHLLTDPELRFLFNVDIIDVNQNILKATYKQIY